MAGEPGQIPSELEKALADDPRLKEINSKMEQEVKQSTKSGLFSKILGVGLAGLATYYLVPYYAAAPLLSKAAAWIGSTLGIGTGYGAAALAGITAGPVVYKFPTILSTMTRGGKSLKAVQAKYAPQIEKITKEIGQKYQHK